MENDDEKDNIINDTEEQGEKTMKIIWNTNESVYNYHKIIFYLCNIVKMEQKIITLGICV